MPKRFNAADYNLVANPSLPKTNSSLPLWGCLIASAVVIALAWQFFSPEIRLSRPVLAFTPEKITATSEVTNRTALPVTLKIRFALAPNAPVTDRYGNFGQSFPIGRQDRWVTVPPHSATSVTCDFAQSEDRVVYPEAQILEQR